MTSPVTSIILEDLPYVRTGLSKAVLGPISTRVLLAEGIRQFRSQLNSWSGRLDIAILDMKLEETYDALPVDVQTKWSKHAEEWLSGSSEESPLRHMYEPDSVGISQLYSGFIGLFALGVYQQRNPHRLPPLIVIYTANKQLREVFWPFTNEVAWAGRPFIMVEKDKQTKNVAQVAESEKTRFMRALRQLEHQRYSAAQWRGYRVSSLKGLLAQLNPWPNVSHRARLHDVATEIFEEECGPDGYGESLTLRQLFPILAHEILGGLEPTAHSDECNLAAERVTDAIQMLGAGHYPTVLHGLIGDINALHYPILHELAQSKNTTGIDPGLWHRDCALKLQMAVEQAVPGDFHQRFMGSLAKITDANMFRNEGRPRRYFSYHWQFYEGSAPEWSADWEQSWVDRCAQPWKEDWRDPNTIGARIESLLKDKPVTYLARQLDLVHDDYTDADTLAIAVIRHVELALETKCGATKVWVVSLGHSDGTWTLDIIDNGKGFVSTGHFRNSVLNEGKNIRTTMTNLSGWAEMDIYTIITSPSIQTDPAGIYHMSVNAGGNPLFVGSWPGSEQSCIPWSEAKSLVRFTIYPHFHGFRADHSEVGDAS